MNMSKKQHSIFKTILLVLSSLCFFYVGAALASASSSSPPGSIGAVADNVKESFGSVAMVITSGAYVGGMAFVLGAIFKFKAHKDNPNQESIGKPIALLFIGAAMIFLPSVFSTTGVTLFGQQASSQTAVGGIEGVTSFTTGQ